MRAKVKVEVWTMFPCTYLCTFPSENQPHGWWSDYFVAYLCHSRELLLKKTAIRTAEDPESQRVRDHGEYWWECAIFNTKVRFTLIIVSCISCMHVHICYVILWCHCDCINCIAACRYLVCIIWLISWSLWIVIARPPQLYFRTPSHRRVNASRYREMLKRKHSQLSCTGLQLAVTLFLFLLQHISKRAERGTTIKATSLCL